eukprot:TRINITY_DN8468_c0_g1_i5.p1 TRINITY_DN8468_c0_g1~~TRINITY_DN8468_c0_g1_i5.p1  ORF type:complete len:339 (+),score=30.57 TRINITY_DN8468_c0_g1_i5:66-1082(+)
MCIRDSRYRVYIPKKSCLIVNSLSRQGYPYLRTIQSGEAIHKFLKAPKLWRGGARFYTVELEKPGMYYFSALYEQSEIKVNEFPNDSPRVEYSIYASIVDSCNLLPQANIPSVLHPLEIMSTADDTFFIEGESPQIYEGAESKFPNINDFQWEDHIILRTIRNASSTVEYTPYFSLEDDVFRYVEERKYREKFSRKVKITDTSSKYKITVVHYLRSPSGYLGQYRGSVIVERPVMLLKANSIAKKLEVGWLLLGLLLFLFSAWLFCHIRELRQEKAAANSELLSSTQQMEIWTLRTFTRYCISFCLKSLFIFKVRTTLQNSREVAEYMINQITSNSLS